MAPDEWLAEGLAPKRIDDAVDCRNSRSDSARCLDESGRQRAIRKMENADAARSEAANEFAEQCQAIGRWHALEDPVAVDQIKLSIRGEQVLRRLERDV